MDPNYPDAPEDLAARARELENLQDLIRKPFTRDQLISWSRVSPLRVEILGDTLWGVIRWLKSYGRPLGPTLAKGFNIEHRFYDEFTYVGEGGVLTTVRAWWPVHSLSTWETEDQDSYTVGFLSHQARHKTNRVEVRFAAGVPWAPGTTVPTPRHLMVSPPSRVFEATGNPMVLEEFVVIPDALRPR